ncbi:hypothetical protein K432DRAFT_225243 [Lepidopterella palustris CBS 459.81]|uniref:Uncharacterized protein n=1 Tax=Lepidopterella palustris CBS 459.81 TaxID=1314670 RepID=A0A8E2EEF6_9PEZI|nr:hypothetical protein K432DRAFT_225243 [Lepidopterella palustris CBS 459.81]
MPYTTTSPHPMLILPYSIDWPTLTNPSRIIADTFHLIGVHRSSPLHLPLTDPPRSSTPNPQSTLHPPTIPPSLTPHRAPSFCTSSMQTSTPTPETSTPAAVNIHTRSRSSPA